MVCTYHSLIEVSACIQSPHLVLNMQVVLGKEGPHVVTDLSRIFRIQIECPLEGNKDARPVRNPERKYRWLNCSVKVL